MTLRVQITLSNYNASTQATRSGLSLSAKTASISCGSPETFPREVAPHPTHCRLGQDLALQPALSVSRESETWPAGEGGRVSKTSRRLGPALCVRILRALAKKGLEGRAGGGEVRVRGRVKEHRVAVAVERVHPCASLKIVGKRCWDHALLQSQAAWSSRPQCPACKGRFRGLQRASIAYLPAHVAREYAEGVEVALSDLRDSSYLWIKKKKAQDPSLIEILF